MTPEQAINLVINLSQKMSGLSVGECRHYDAALDIIKKALIPEPPKPAELPRAS